jgi:hypothetical protein
VIGATAASIGTEPVFGSVLIITLVLAYAASRLPRCGCRSARTRARS